MTDQLKKAIERAEWNLDEAKRQYAQRLQDMHRDVEGAIEALEEGRNPGHHRMCSADIERAEYVAAVHHLRTLQRLADTEVVSS